jgi:hypothetical protein
VQLFRQDGVAQPGMAQTKTVLAIQRWRCHERPLSPLILLEQLCLQEGKSVKVEILSRKHLEFMREVSALFAVSSDQCQEAKRARAEKTGPTTAHYACALGV